MISISVYRSYTPPAWARRQTGYVPVGGQRARPAAQIPERDRGPARPAPEGARRGPAPSRRWSLPAGLDSGDLFLAAMLLFLYSESRDEDFLIILIVVGLSIFQSRG